MFGYVNVNRKELSEENKIIYQSFYCGLCQALKRNFSAKEQMTLNYDVTFLAILLSGLYEPEEKREKFTCGIHPTKRKWATESVIMDYAANMNVILSYHKMMDDWKDDKRKSKQALAAIMRKDYKKAAALYPRQAKAVERYMEKTAEVELTGETNIDLVAGLTGEMLGELLSYREDEWYEELKNLGYYLGKFIYLMDAYEDLEKDTKKNAYNPLILLKEKNKEDFEPVIKIMMTSILSETAKSFERLPILLYADILRNILYSGVWNKYDLIQNKKNQNKKN